MKTPCHFTQALFGALLLFSFCAPGWGSPHHPVVSPTRAFYLEAPAVGADGTSPITPMSSVQGTYMDNSANLPEDAAVTFMMDEKGKFLVGGSMVGYEDKKGNSVLERKAKVKTVNGVPVLTVKGSTSGTLDDGTEHSVKATAKVSVPVVPSGPASGGMVPITATNSYSGKQDGVSDKAKKDTETVQADETQIKDVASNEWFLYLDIYDYFDHHGNPIVVADLFLKKPNKEGTLFDLKEIKYSEQGGYSFTCKGGDAFDEFDQPIVDVHGDRVRDTKSSIKFSNLLFEMPGTVWNIKSGDVDYQFLGQKGFGAVLNFIVTYNP